MQTLSVSDDEEMQMVMELLSKCKRECKIEASCMICLSEKLSMIKRKSPK